MRQKSVPEKEPATQVVKNIRRATRRHFSAEDKIRIVLEGLRGEDSIAELCRREGIVQNLYYRWSKDFLEAGKKRLAGDTARAATSDEVKDLRRVGKLKLLLLKLLCILLTAFGIERTVCRLDILEALSGLRNAPSDSEIIGLSFDHQPISPGRKKEIGVLWT